MSKLIRGLRNILATPFVAVAWICFGIAMYILPQPEHKP